MSQVTYLLRIGRGYLVLSAPAPPAQPMVPFSSEQCSLALIFCPGRTVLSVALTCYITQPTVGSFRQNDHAFRVC